MKPANTNIRFPNIFLDPRSLCQIGDDEMKWIKKKKLTVSCKRDEEIIVELCPKKCVMLLAGSPNRRWIVF